MVFATAIVLLVLLPVLAIEGVTGAFVQPFARPLPSRSSYRWWWG